MKTAEMTHPLETTKTPLGASERDIPGVGKGAVYFALRKAFNLIGRLLFGYVMFVGIYWDNSDKRTSLEKWREAWKALREIQYLTKGCYEKL